MKAYSVMATAVLVVRIGLLTTWSPSMWKGAPGGSAALIQVQPPARNAISMWSSITIPTVGEDTAKVLPRVGGDQRVD